MAKYLNVTITSPETVAQLNQDVVFDGTKQFESIRSLVTFLEGIEAGAKPGPVTISVVVTDVDPAVSAHGGGSSTSYSIG